MTTIHVRSEYFEWGIWGLWHDPSFRKIPPSQMVTPQPDIDPNELSSVIEYLTYGDYRDWMQFPIVYHIVDGKRFRDFLELRWLYSYLISDRLKTLLEQAQVTGWKSYPITLYDKKGNLVEGYHGFTITGRAAQCDNEDECDADLMKNPGRETVRPIFNLKNWDGSDIFRIAKSKLVVTERVVKLMRANKIQAIDVHPLEEEMDLYKG